MFLSGTPCPILVKGKLVVGRNAYMVMKANPEFYIPDYKDNSEYYDIILGIGKEDDNDEEISNLSISERYRTSIRD